MFKQLDLIKEVDKYFIGDDRIFIITPSTIKHKEFVKLPFDSKK